MRVAADDHIDLAQLGGHCQVGGVALMRDQDDVPDSPCAQFVYRLAGSLDLVEKARARERARRVHRLAAHLDADDADGQSVQAFADVWLQVAVRLVRRQR